MKTIIQNIGIVLIALFSSANLSAQCPTITCPGDITVSNDAGTCGAVVNYTTPIGTDACASSGAGNFLFVCDGDNSTATEIPAELTAAGHTVTTVYNDYVGGNNATLQGAGISNYDAIFWHASGASGYGEIHNAATFTNLSNYVNAGGAVFVTGYDVIASPTDPELIAFMGGTSSTDGGSQGTETLVGSNSLTTGVTNIVGLTLNSTGDHDGLNGLQAGTIGVATNGTSHGWTIRTLGAGEIAWVSTANFIGQPWPAWNTPGSGYQEALLNFAANHSCSGGANILFVTDGPSSHATEIPVVLSGAGYTVTSVNDDYVAGNNTVLQGSSLSNYDIIYWHASGSTGFGEVHNAATFTNLSTFVNAGGAVFITGYDVIASPTDPELIAFMGGTSSTDGGSQGTETLVGTNSLTTGVTNIVGLTLNTTGDHDGLNNLQAGTVGVATNGTSHGWAIRTLGAGEIAWVSSTQSGTNTFPAWTTAGSGYNEALLNFAANHACGAGIGTPTTTMIAGLADGATFPVGSTTVTYEVVDGAGNNPQTCSFIVTVTDNEAPVADVATLADVNETCAATPNAPTATDNCAGTLTGTPDATFPITAQGTTVVTWTYDDGNGNTSTQTQNVIISGVETGVTQSGATLTSDAAGATYQWLDCDNSFAPLAGETNASFTPVATVGNYAVEVTENGCVDTSACFLVDITGLSDFEVSGLSVYPNPNTGSFFVESSSQLLESITVTDNKGRKVKEINTISELKTSINMVGLSTGIYFVKMNGEFGTITKKIVVQ